MDSMHWISVVTAAITVAAIVGVARMLSGKANKSDVEAVGQALAGKANKVDVDKEFNEVNKKFEALHADNKNEADESLRQYRELVIALEALKDRIVALDKNSLTKSDLIDIKSDIKELTKGIAESLKLIDGMPDRLVSLEATRNKQSER